LVRVKYLYRRGFLKNCRAAVNYPLFNYLLKSVIFISVPEEKYNRFIGNAKATREVTQCFELKMKSPLIKSRQFLVSLMAKDNEDLKAIVYHYAEEKANRLNMNSIEKHKDTSFI
jgi:DNA-binding Lrp family transcriptional regulator